jgi:hypothetical protein
LHRNFQKGPKFRRRPEAKDQTLQLTSRTGNLPVLLIASAACRNQQFSASAAAKSKPVAELAVNLPGRHQVRIDPHPAMCQ